MATKPRRKPQPQPRRTGAPDAEHLARLSQYSYAFGHGAGGAHVSREALCLFNEKYLEAIKQAYLKESDSSFPSWDKRAPVILGLMIQVGRLAAHLSLRNNRTTILVRDLKRAAKKVQDSIDKPHVEGIDCPPSSSWV